MVRRRVLFVVFRFVKPFLPVAVPWASPFFWVRNFHNFYILCGFHNSYRASNACAPVVGRFNRSCRQLADCTRCSPTRPSTVRWSPRRSVEAPNVRRWPRSTDRTRRAWASQLTTPLHFGSCARRKTFAYRLLPRSGGGGVMKPGRKKRARYETGEFLCNFTIPHGTLRVGIPCNIPDPPENPCFLFRIAPVGPNRLRSRLHRNISRDVLSSPLGHVRF